MSKNAFQLTNKTKKNGYDWWWHSFVAKNAKTCELQPFFIEYYVINPALDKGKIVLGQSEEAKKTGQKPCYAMIKAGTWGKNKAQIHNFYKISAFSASTSKLDCKILDNIVTETKLVGHISIFEKESKEKPELMSDAGCMKWNLTMNKKVKYDVGYGSSKLFNKLNIFEMYWHVGGMITEFEGELEFNDEKFIVEKETSFGYQDKNWGQDYTNPWIWLNCNNLFSTKQNKKINAGLDIGGGCPKVLGIPLKRRILTAFCYENKLYEFNFSKFWKYSKQSFNSTEDDEYIYWNVDVKNSKIRLEIRFKCKKEYLLNVNYENPKGEKNHNKLWNGGHAQGTIKIYKKDKLVDELQGAFGGCEYGKY